MDEEEIIETMRGFGVDVQPIDPLIIEKWLRRRNLDALVHYLVDWLVFGPSGQLTLLVYDWIIAMTLSALLIPLLTWLFILCAIMLFISLFIFSAIISIMLQPYLITLFFLVIVVQLTIYIYIQIQLFIELYLPIIEYIIIGILVFILVILLLLYVFGTTLPWTIYLLYDSMYLSREWCSIIIIIFGGNQKVPDDPDLRRCDVMFLTRKSYPQEMVELEALLLELTYNMFQINPLSIIWACIWYYTLLASATFFQMIILPQYVSAVIAFHALFGIDEKERPY